MKYITEIDPIMRKMIQTMYEDGMQIKKIQAILQITYYQVSSVVRDYNSKRIEVLNKQVSSKLELSILRLINVASDKNACIDVRKKANYKYKILSTFYSTVDFSQGRIVQVPTYLLKV